MFSAAVGEEGLAAEARELARVAAVLGVKAASAGPADVASARLAATDATSAGLSPAALPRSRFGELPAPAMPDCERLSASRAGSALGSAAPTAPVAAAGFSTFEGEAEAAALRVVRCGEFEATALGLIDGAAEFVARAMPAPPSGVPAPVDGASSEGCVRVAAGFEAAFCREARAAVALAESVCEALGPLVVSTFAARVTRFGVPAVVARLVLLAAEEAALGWLAGRSFRVIRDATCVVSGEFGAAAGSPAAGFSEIDADCVLATATACGPGVPGSEDLASGLVGVSTEAVGRGVTRGWRLATEVGAEATPASGLVSSSGLAEIGVGAVVRKFVGSVGARSVVGPAVFVRVAAMLFGFGSVSLFRFVIDGASASFTCDLGVSLGRFNARLRVAVAVLSGLGASSGVLRAMATSSVGFVAIGSV